MTKFDDGGPAFPHEWYGIDIHGRQHGYKGMTLWDYFAAHALEGLLAYGMNQAMAAQIAAEQADELLAERRKRIGG